MKLFKIAKYPALSFYVKDRRFKFVGGKLAVEDELAEDIRNYAAMRPEYEILEVPGEHELDPNPLTTVPDRDAQKAGPVGGVVGTLTSPRKEDNATDPELDATVGAPPATELTSQVEDDANDAGDAGDVPAGQGDALNGETESEVEDKPAFDEAAARDYFDGMVNADIRKALEAEGLNVSGNHRELVDRAVQFAADKYAADQAALDEADQD